MHIGFISTRLAGTDGVSLETHKLAAVLRQMGHDIFYCAGELEGDIPGMLIPEIHFRDAAALTLGEWAFSGTEPDPKLDTALQQRAAQLQRPLRQFLTNYQIDYVIAQNIFAIPMQLPLAQALAELLKEMALPGLAHNHDFYWERERFRSNRISTFLDTYFPPSLPHLQHAVINTAAQRDLKARRQLDSILLPNVFNFAVPAPGIDAYNRDFRQTIGLRDDDWLILQPTRVIPRKGIELSIELLARLRNPRAKLVITHHAGDEGMAYLQQLQQMAAAQDVDLRYVADIIDDVRHPAQNGRKRYTLWDTYPHANLIAYPSLYEGFGNALIETIYFSKPALVNRYAVYAEDIGPLGFQFAEIDGKLTDTAVATVRHWLEQPETAQASVIHNYQLGQQHFSYETLTAILQTIPYLQEYAG